MYIEGCGATLPQRSPVELHGQLGSKQIIGQNFSSQVRRLCMHNFTGVFAVNPHCSLKPKLF